MWLNSSRRPSWAGRISWRLIGYVFETCRQSGLGRSKYVTYDILIYSAYISIAMGQSGDIDDIEKELDGSC